MKDYKAEDIKATLLINGDEIIGPIEADSNGTQIFTKPAKFIPSQQGVMVLSLFMCGDFETCTIKNSHIISTVPVKEEVAEIWLEQVAGKKSIIKPKGGIVVP